MNDHKEPAVEPAKTLNEAVIRILHPVPFIALLIIFSIFFLIGAAIFGRDTVLLSMSDHNFARGLITYLFAVTTVTTSVLLVVAGLIGGPEVKDKFARGKDILALMLGVFGTIVGFYFGAEVSHQDTAASPSVIVSQPLLDSDLAVAGTTLTVRAWVASGTPPYQVAAVVGETLPAEYGQELGEPGWVTVTVPVPPTAVEIKTVVTIGARDASGQEATAGTGLTVQPAPR